MPRPSTTPYQSPANISPNNADNRQYMSDSLYFSLTEALRRPIDMSKLQMGPTPTSRPNPNFGRPGWSAWPLVHRRVWPTPEVEELSNDPLSRLSPVWSISPKLALALVGVHPSEATWLTLRQREAVIYTGLGTPYDGNEIAPPPNSDAPDYRKIRAKVPAEITRFFHHGIEHTSAQWVMLATPACLVSELAEHPNLPWDSSMPAPRGFKSIDALRKGLSTLSVRSLTGISRITGVPAHSFIRYAATDLLRRGTTYMSWYIANMLAKQVGAKTYASYETCLKATEGEDFIPMGIGEVDDDRQRLLRDTYSQALVVLAKAMEQMSGEQSGLTIADDDGEEGEGREFQL